MTRGKLLQILVAVAGVAACGIAITMFASGNLSTGQSDEALDAGDTDERLAIEDSGRATSGNGMDGVDGPHAAMGESSGSSVTVAEGPDTFSSVFDRLLGAGLMTEYSAELMELMGGRELAVDPPIDIYTLMDRVRGARGPKELAAVVAPLAKALREIARSKDPALEEDRKRIALALMVAGQDVTYAEDLTPEQRMEALWHIAGALGTANIPEFSLALADLAGAIDMQGLGERGKRLAEGMARTRVDAMLTMRDVQGFDQASAIWMATAADQREPAEAARIRTYGARLMAFTPAELSAQGAPSWPGLSDLSAEAISRLGTNWLKPGRGRSPEQLAMVRDALLGRLDGEIAQRRARGDAPGQVAAVQAYRDAVAATAKNRR